MRTKKKSNAKKSYALHWFTEEPFGRVVVLVIGDYKCALKECDKVFRPKDRNAHPFSEFVEEQLDDRPCKCSPDHCGRTISNDVGDVFMLFPAFPTPGTLAHELFHAVTNVLNSAGVTDTNGETDAYLLGDMYDHFFTVLEEDKKMKRVAV